MLKQQAMLFKYFTGITDSVVLVFSFLFACSFGGAGAGFGETRESLWMLVVILPIWYYLFEYFGLYSSMRTRPLRAIFAAVVKAHAAGAVLTSSVFFLYAPPGFSRTSFGLFILVSLLLVCLEKTVVKQTLSGIRKRGYNFRHILIVGGDERARRVAGLIEQHADWGLKIVGFLRYGEGPSGKWIAGYPWLGELEEIADICAKHAVDEVVFCLPKEALTAVDDHRPALENMGVTVRMVLETVSDWSILLPRRQELSYFHGEIPMLTYYGKPFDARQLLLKRSLDVAGAVVGLALTALLFPFIAVAVLLDSPGPLFFRQERVGENGRRFTCWKFRSMYKDAEERKRELLPLNEMSGAIFKIRDDPRVTRVGRVLRRTSLDELPQFWNVLRGEMSLVGTRPPTPDEVARYEHWHRKRICIKPGITGLWQVSGRNKIRNFDEVAHLDIEYIDRWSLWLDIKILLKTFRVLLGRKGAF